MKNHYSTNKKKNKISIITNSLIILFFSLIIYSCTEVVAPEDITPPNTPANFTLLGGGDGQVRLRWSQNTEPDFNFFRLYRSVNNINSFSKLVELTQVEYLDRFLEYDTTYFYYLTAVDNAGNESDPTFIIDVQPLNVAAPQPPIFLISSGVNNPLLSILEMKLNWTPPDIGDLLRYKIYRSNDSDFVANTSTLVDSTIIATYSDRFIPTNTKYYYKIVAVDKRLKVSLPSKPNGDMILSSPILVAPANQTRFTSPRIFDWDPVDNAVSYVVFVGSAPFSDVLWNSSKTTNTEFQYNGPALQSSQVYYWWVGAYSRNKIVLENGTEVSSQVNSYSVVNSFFAE
jgi:fibronectin type 3 domain-containing protein